MIPPIPPAQNGGSISHPNPPHTFPLPIPESTIPPPDNIPGIPWDELCAPATDEFFERHCRYIQIDISGTTPLQQRTW